MSESAVQVDVTAFRVGSWRCTLSQLQYFTFTVIGVALLWPWNCFLSASAYYGERFFHTPSLVKIYSLTMMSVSTIVSTTFSFYLSQSQRGVDYKQRINIGLFATIAVFLLMAISCVSDLFVRMNDYVFFIYLMVMVFVSATATCLAQNGTMATVNVLGKIYTNAVMVGQAIAGTLPSVVLIASILIVGVKERNPNVNIGEDEHVDKNFGVFIYYITASLISVASIALLALTGSESSKTLYRSLNHLIEEGEEVERVHDESNMGPFSDDEDTIRPINVVEPGLLTDSLPPAEIHVPFGVMWAKLKLIVMTIFSDFAVTLVFPVFASIVESVHSDSDHIFFHKTIFIPFIYLIWNLGDLIGRLLCGASNSVFLIKSPNHLIIYSLLRFLFVPLFMTCNIHPLSLAPLILSDLWYILLQFLFGFSNGQLATSCFMVVGDHCDNDNERRAAGGFTTVFLSTGLAVGSILSYLLVLVIN